MKEMFKDYESLSSLSDISNWNTANIISMWLMFEGCKSSSSLPDISKWNIEKDDDMYGVFKGSKKLKKNSKKKYKKGCFIS